MYNFVISVGEDDTLLNKPDVVSFVVVGRDGDILVASCDYINNIQPALAAMLEKIKIKEDDEKMVEYIRNAYFYITAAATVADVYNQKQKCVIGSYVVQSACLRHFFVGNVGYLCDVGAEGACAEIQKGVFNIYEKCTESAG